MKKADVILILSAAGLLAVLFVSAPSAQNIYSGLNDFFSKLPETVGRATGYTVYRTDLCCSTRTGTCFCISKNSGYSSCSAAGYSNCPCSSCKNCNCAATTTTTVPTTTRKSTTTTTTIRPTTVKSTTVKPTTVKSTTTAPTTIASTTSSTTTTTASLSKCINIVNNGDQKDKLDIVFIGDKIGSKVTNFESIVNTYTNRLLSFEPFKTYSSRINVRRVDASEDLGCYFDGTCITCDYNKIYKLASNCPYDQIVVLGYDEKAASCAEWGIVYMNTKHLELFSWMDYEFVHEFGHSFGRLMDTFFYFTDATQGSKPWGPNCDDSPKCSKWNGVEGRGCPSGNSEQSGCVKGCTYQNWYSEGCANDIMGGAFGENSRFSPASKKQLISLLDAYK